MARRANFVPVLLIVLLHCSVIVFSMSEANYTKQDSRGRLFEAAGGPVSDGCLHCICFTLSGCKMPKPVCQMDVGSLSCGQFKIDQAAWSDARLKGGDLMGSWRLCSGDEQCSRDTVQGYMARFAVRSRTGHQPTCEDFARIHVGGPNGFKNPSTVKFWERVKECLE